jgi:hypothetical protein
VYLTTLKSLIDWMKNKKKINKQENIISKKFIKPIIDIKITLHKETDQKFPSFFDKLQENEKLAIHHSKPFPFFL